jgi:hypothetical protein
MQSSGILRFAALDRTDALEELSDSIIRVTRIGELGATEEFRTSFLPYRKDHDAVRRTVVDWNPQGTRTRGSPSNPGGAWRSVEERHREKLGREGR